MSRIGRLPIAVPAGVEVKLEEGNVITVKGAKGTLTRKLVDDLTITVENNEIVVTRPSDLKRYKSLHGLTRTLIANMIVGVTEGYKKELEINGVGYRAAKAGNKLNLTLGYSHPVEMEDPEGVTTTVEGSNKIIVSGIDKEKGYSHPVEMEDPEGVTTTVEGSNKIIVSGIDKEKVGQFAAEIRAKRPPEPYKGKGIKYTTEHIRRKVGKTGKK